ncbi:MAG: hypothetical protein WAT12_17430, partial [Candidatus Nitrotoga sp.]
NLWPQIYVLSSIINYSVDSQLAFLMDFRIICGLGLMKYREVAATIRIHDDLYQQKYRSGQGC